MVRQIGFVAEIMVVVVVVDQVNQERVDQVAVRNNLAKHFLQQDLVMLEQTDKIMHQTMVVAVVAVRARQEVWVMGQ